MNIHPYSRSHHDYTPQVEVPGKSHANVRKRLGDSIITWVRNILNVSARLPILGNISPALLMYCAEELRSAYIIFSRKYDRSSRLYITSEVQGNTVSALMSWSMSRELHSMRHILFEISESSRDDDVRRIAREGYLAIERCFGNESFTEIQNCLDRTFSIISELGSRANQ